MSTRVLPVGGFFNFTTRMSEFRRRIEPPSVSPQEASPSQEESQDSLLPRTVRRNLFGPIDHDENMKFVQDELQKIAAADRRRWNFDFPSFNPLDGRYSWEETRGGEVPAAYEMPNLTAKLTLPNSYPSSSKVTDVSASSVAPNSHATTSKGKTHEDHLRSTLTTVTTATTTVMSINNPQKQNESPVVSIEPSRPSSNSPPSSETTIANSTSFVEQSSTTRTNSKEERTKKQTLITEYLKNKKRTHSSESKIESSDALPALKRAKTSS